MKEGKEIINKEKKGLVQELNPGKNFLEDGKDDYKNCRYGLSNGDLSNKIISIRQSRAEEERSLERRAECQTESKAFAKSTMARTVRAPGLDWWKESAIDCKRRRT